MKIFYSPKFHREYKKLSLSIKRRAEKKEAIFRKNPFDIRLSTHKLKGRLCEYWAFRIDTKYRIVFEFHTPDIIWFHAVGDHSIYQLLER